jgi:protein pelota
LEANRKFTITKREWDSIALDRVYESCDPGQNADLAAVVMQEGIANLCLVLSSMTLVKAKIEVNVAKKRKGVNSGYDKSLEKFFERIVVAMVAHINFEGLFCLQVRFHL